MTTTYELRLTPAARRALTEPPPVGLPHPVAAAAGEFVAGPLLENPRRIGKALDPPLQGQFSARRGEYRIVYTIDEQASLVTVVAIAHRRDAYRRR